MQDGTETPRVMVSPDSNAGPLILGGLQNSLADTFASESTESDEHVKQEMAVMRDDLELLRHAVQARKAGKLEVSELAEARQAANDCSGWLHQTRRAASADGPHAPRLEQPRGLLGGYEGGAARAPARDGGAPSHLPGRLPRPQGLRDERHAARVRDGGGAAIALLHLGQTPRTRELFMSGAGTGDGTDRAVHDFFVGTSTGATT
jgi:hypothetical protein